MDGIKIRVKKLQKKCTTFDVNKRQTLEIVYFGNIENCIFNKFIC